MNQTESSIFITDDMDLMLGILPQQIKDRLYSLKDLPQLIEVVMDLGRRPEARFPHNFEFLSDQPVTKDNIAYVVKHTGAFNKDNRAGIERTLHRISGIRNRSYDIVGLTCRVGRAVYGTINIIRDIIEQSEESILILGRPGVGKTTLLREVARVLSDDFAKRVVVVDTSNEIAGDGDIPHPGIGGARRMQVPEPSMQHSVMIEAVENHMPEVVVVDEIGTIEEAYAARTIAERGVRLIATAHGNNAENLLMNPTLSDLLGGIDTVTISDEEARRRHTQKTILERKAPPTFNIVIEIQKINTLAIHKNVGEMVDLLLRGTPPQPEVRLRTENGNFDVIQKSNIEEFKMPETVFPTYSRDLKDVVCIYPYAISRTRLYRAIDELSVKADISSKKDDCDLILTTKSQEKKSQKLKVMKKNGISIYTVKSNSIDHIKNFLKSYFHLPDTDLETMALKDAKDAIEKILKGSKPIELAPRNSYLRRLQHKLAEQYKLKSRSTGIEPQRRLRIYSP